MKYLEKYVFDMIPDITLIPDFPTKIDETFLFESSISNWILWLLSELIISIDESQQIHMKGPVSSIREIDINI